MNQGGSLNMKLGGYEGFLETGRPVSYGQNGAVASPHYLASQVGQEIIKKGGHAVEAGIAMSAVLCVVYPHMSGLGGDLFSIVWENDKKKTVSINGSGRSGSEVNREQYKDHEVIPERGPLAANTVPGTVDAWWTLHQEYGKLKWEELFKDAIWYAEEGFPVSGKLSGYIRDKKILLKKFTGTSKLFLPDGKVLKPGEILKQSDLAWVLKTIAERGADGFYQGEVAEKMIDSLRKEGGLLNKEDLMNHETLIEETLTTDYKGYTVHETRPNTQGIAALMMMNILKQHDMEKIGDNTSDYYHLMAEAAKIAFYYRDKWVTDSRFLDIPTDDLLSDQHAKAMNDMIKSDSVYDLDQLDQLPEIKSSKDTVYMSAIDGEGNAISLIQSIYHEFGSAFIPEGCGFILQNRGSFFSLDENHPNTLEPNKRTFHTIIPAMVTKDDKPFMIFGTMGGEGQPQTQCAILTRVVDFGYNIQQAIEAPRWLYGRMWGDASMTFKLESRIPDSIRKILKAKGHLVEIEDDYSQTMGHAQGIVIDPETGLYSAGADPRGDGLALSW